VTINKYSVQYIKENIMSAISAVELKRRGVSALAPLLRQEGEAVITVHGKSRYVVMTAEKYDALRELELVAAVREARADYAVGRIADATVKGHMRRIRNEV
jgi:prevent-host-death family protein